MRIQPDIIKLDRSLVANVDTDPAKAALIDSFVRFARRTGATVCAEGIETPEELRGAGRPRRDLRPGLRARAARGRRGRRSAPWVAGTIRSAPRAPTHAQSTRPTARTPTCGSPRSRRGSRTSARATSCAASAALIASELGADEVALPAPRRPAPGTLEPVGDQPWLPAGTPLALRVLPDAAGRSSRRQQVVQVLAADDARPTSASWRCSGAAAHARCCSHRSSPRGEVVGLLVAWPRRAPWTPGRDEPARIVGHQLGAVVDGWEARPSSSRCRRPERARGRHRQA